MISGRILARAGESLLILLMLFAPVIGYSQRPGKISAPEPEEAEEEIITEDDGSFSINFEDVELEDIIKNFSQITGRNFILDQVPKGKITIISPVKMPKDQAFKVFEAILNLNGYNLAETAVPNLYRIVRTGEVMRSNIPIYSGGKVPEVSDAFVTRFIPLDYLEAQDVSNTIQPLLSKDGGNVVAYSPTNTIILVDTALNIERILSIIKILDIPSEEAEFDIVYLRYTLAQELVGTLNQIFTGDKQTTQRRTKTAAPKTSGARRSRTSTTTTATPTQQSGEISLKIIPENRLNALILIGDRDMIQEVKDVINLLDVDVGEKGLIHVYYCKNAVASELAGTLANLAGARTSSSSLGTSTASRTATAAGRIVPSTSRTTTATQATSSGFSLSGIFSGDIKITADEPTNSLIIVASPQDYETVKMVLEKLDIPRRQVFVEAALLEVTMTTGRDWNTSMHGASPLEDEGAVVGGSSYSTLNSISLLSLLAQGTSLPSGVTIGALGAPVDVPGGEISIPSVGVLVQMLASDSNVNVLSTPTILTMDNEEAQIQVGQRIPVPTGQTVSSGGLSSVSISRENVGIMLTITPQINESGTIRLDISTEISSAVSSSLGINVNTLGVTTSIKTAQTTVVVKDAQTIIIGGLMEDRQNSSKSRVPFIGDIPVLGWLFKSQSKNKTKSNLIILLTPHIVRTDEDIEGVRNQIKSDYDSFVEENLGKKFQKWDEYFGARYQGAFETQESRVIDVTGGEPEIRDEEIILPELYEYEAPDVLETETVETETGEAIEEENEFIEEPDAENIEETLEEEPPEEESQEEME